MKKWIIWVVVVLVLIAIAVGIVWFLNANVTFGGGNNLIPQPPALPD